MFDTYVHVLQDLGAAGWILYLLWRVHRLKADQMTHQETMDRLRAVARASKGSAVDYGND